MLSTLHFQPDVDASSSDRKADVVLYCDSTKEDVDTFDRMDIPWPLRVNVISAVALNILILQVLFVKVFHSLTEDAAYSKCSGIFYLNVWQTVHICKSTSNWLQFRYSVWYKIIDWKI